MLLDVVCRCETAVRDQLRLSENSLKNLRISRLWHKTNKPWPLWHCVNGSKMYFLFCDSDFWTVWDRRSRCLPTLLTLTVFVVAAPCGVLLLPFARPESLGAM